MDPSMQIMSFSGALPSFSKPLVEWNVGDVQEFLGRCSNKLGYKTSEYQRIVGENDIDGEVLKDLDDDDLQRLGIKSFGHRTFIAKMIKHYFGFSGRLGVGGGNGGQNGGGQPGGHGGASGAGGAGGSSERRQFEHQSSWSSDSTVATSNSAMPHHAPVAHTPLLVEERFLFTTPKYPGDASYNPAGQPYGQLNVGVGVRAFAQAEPRIQNATLRIHESKIKIHNKIGTGSVATVFAGTYESHKVAIKKHTFDHGIDGKTISDLELEVGKMTAVNHPCIVRCFGMLEPTPGIVLELVEGGSVFEIIHGHKGETFQAYNGRLPWQHRLSFLLDMMYGLRAIHNVGMIHGDLKTLNLLVTLEGRVKVADFGLSKLLGTVSIVPGTKTISGTPQYMAPEVMHCKPQGLRVDMYSVGIVMWEVMTGVIPWKDMDYVQIIQRVTHQANDTSRPPPGRPPMDNMYRAVAPSGYITLLEECWAQDPKWRPSADQCVEYLEEIKRRVHIGPFPHDQATQQGAHAHSWGTDAQMQGAASSAIGDCDHKNENDSDNRQISNEQGGKRQRVEGSMPYTGPGGAGGGGWDRVALHRPPQAQGPEFHHPLKPPNMFMASGGLFVLVEMLKSGNTDKVMQALSAVFEMCVNNSANQQALFDASVLDHIFPLLDWWDRPDVQTKATNCIAVASSQSPHNRRTVVNMGAVASLVRLLSASPQQQEAAAQAIANTVKRPTAEEQQVLNDWEELTNTKGTIIDAQEELNRFGGVEKLVQLMEKGSSRVKVAAAAAAANAMTECSENRVAFQESNGIAQVIRMLKEGDCNAQDNATTALWNAMVDNPMAVKDFNRLNGHQYLVIQLNTGTSLGKELAAGAIWKACASDDSDKQHYTPAVDGLVRLLRTSNRSAHEQAAGALRSVCVNSPINKLELNRVNGISALVEVLRTSDIPAREQAGAALANACANCMENQVAARHSGAMLVLVDQLTSEISPDLVECCVCAIRNLCINSLEHQEELMRCNGMVPLLQLLHCGTRTQLLEYVASAIAKACSLCKGNVEMLRTQYGVHSLQWLLNDENIGAEIKRHVQILVDYVTEDPR